MERIRDQCEEAFRRGLLYSQQEEWMPIESAPKQKTVLLAAQGCDQIVMGYAGYIDSLCTDKHQPTHWQPLPPPPQHESQEKK